MKQNPKTKFYANIEVGDSGFNFSLSKNKSDSAEYSFLMEQQKIQLGNISINQIWLPKNTLYGKDPDQDANRIALINFFWKSSEILSTNRVQDVLETYILATLLPDTRRNASAKLFKDATLQPSLLKKETGKHFINQLDDFIKQTAHERMSQSKFWERTKRFLGPNQFGEETNNLYDEMSKELFPLASDFSHLNEYQVLELVKPTWDKWIKKFGRRGRKNDEINILDILSYEARCALHRCYSWFWSVFTVEIAKTNGYSNEFIEFHHLWHLDPVIESPDDGFQLHLFHGHVPGLHPAGGYLLQTLNGREIVSHYIRNPTTESFERFLNAYYMSCILYESELTKSQKSGGFESRPGYHS